jgi:hypothetical protein
MSWSGNTESGRISNLLSATRQCAAAEALAKARALGKGCGALCDAQPTVRRPQTQIPSMLLSATVTNCYSDYQTLEGCVPESIRIARLQQRNLDLSIDSANVATRFSQYARFFPEPCPAIPASYARAGEPVLQGKNCPLPNKPDNPVLPG